MADMAGQEEALRGDYMTGKACWDYGCLLSARFHLMLGI